MNGRLWRRSGSLHSVFGKGTYLFDWLKFRRRGYSTREMVVRIKRAQRLSQLLHAWGVRTGIFISLAVLSGLGLWQSDAIKQFVGMDGTVGSIKRFRGPGSSLSDGGKPKANQKNKSKKERPRRTKKKPSKSFGCGGSTEPKTTAKEDRRETDFERKLKERQNKRAEELRKSLNTSWWPFGGGSDDGGDSE